MNMVSPIRRPTERHARAAEHYVFFHFNNCGNNTTKASLKPINHVNEALLDKLATHAIKIEIILDE